MHDWGKPIETRDPQVVYQVCRKCGGARRVRWTIKAHPRKGGDA